MGCSLKSFEIYDPLEVNLNHLLLMHKTRGDFRRMHHTQNGLGHVLVLFHYSHCHLYNCLTSCPHPASLSCLNTSSNRVTLSIAVCHSHPAVWEGGPCGMLTSDAKAGKGMCSSCVPKELRKHFYDQLVFSTVHFICNKYSYI